MNFSEGERKAFAEGCKIFDALKAAYDEPQYNAFNQLLRPHYCVHGVANLWADYDDICQYCEDGINSRTQWGMIVLDNYRQRRDKAWARFVLDSLKKNPEGMQKFVDDFGCDYFKPYQKLKRSLGVFSRVEEVRDILLGIQFSQACSRVGGTAW